MSPRHLLLALLAAAAVLIGAPPGSEVLAATTTPTKVLTIIEENHSYSQMRSGMPYLFSLAQKYGYATNWTATSHPSLPNYLALTGGSTFGISGDGPPSQYAYATGTLRSVFDQALDAGKTAKVYAESMPSNCRTTDSGSYLVRHNPWTYYTSKSRCATNDVSLATFASAATSNALPNVGLVVPNSCNDAHSCSLTTADNFLKANLPRILASSDFTTGRLVVIVTADEDNYSSGNGNKVLTSVLSAKLSGKVVSTHLTHYSWTRYMAQVLGVTPLMAGGSAPDMKAAFGL